MQINKLTLTNFQLFKKSEICFSKVNLITGINHDDLQDSGNGSGKTTILNGVLFALYGVVTNLNIADLIKIGSKTASVELECSLGKDAIRVVRTIPSSLKIFVNDEEIKFNTLTIAQKYIDDLFGDVNNFKMYRMMDNTKGINLLDLGVVSLRKNLMQFVDTYFSKIRLNLLAKKNDKERFSVDKRLYHFYLSDKKLKTLEAGIAQLRSEYNCQQTDVDNQAEVVNSGRSQVQTNNAMIAKHKSQLADAQKSGICPILKKVCAELKKDISPAAKKEYEEGVKKLQELNSSIEEDLNQEKDYLESAKKQLQYLRNKIDRGNSYLMKLKEASKFQEYKYTKEDIQLYADAIKALDAFSATYIQEWLTNLSVILNDLLKDLNISVEFSADKSFMKVNNNGQELKYEQLSSGQRVFLNSVFKLAILLNNGTNSGLILIDEGVNNMDSVNMGKFLEILKNLRYQVCLIYQNIDMEIDEVNYIKVERKNGESNAS